MTPYDDATLSAAAWAPIPQNDGPRLCVTCGAEAEPGHDHCLDGPCVLACGECAPEARDDMREEWAR